MNCKTCTEHLYEFVDGTISAKLKAEVSQHLESCFECSLVFEEEVDFTNEPLTEILEQTENMELSEETIREITKRFNE